MRNPFSFNPTAFIKSVNVVDGIVYISTLVLYLWSISMPEYMAAVLSSVYGICILIAGAMYMLLYCKPITGIVSVFLAYRLMQLSQVYTPYKSLQSYQYGYTDYTAPHKAQYVAAPIVQAISESVSPESSLERRMDMSLEESIVNQFAPIGESQPSLFVSAPYKPVNAHHQYEGVEIYG